MERLYHNGKLIAQTIKWVIFVEAGNLLKLKPKMIK